jgi:putative transposase
VRSHGSLYPSRFRRTTIRCFAFIAAGPTFGYLEVEEIKTIPGTPRSHAFVERLIGTIRRGYLDRIWFWKQIDLERQLDDYQRFYNQYRCHTGLGEVTPAHRGGAAPPLAHLDSYRWRPHCNGLFHTPIAA